MKKIAFAGTDGRTLLCALVVSSATSALYEDQFEGIRASRAQTWIHQTLVRMC